MKTVVHLGTRKSWMMVCAVLMAGLAWIAWLPPEVSGWRVLLGLLLLACPAIVIGLLVHDGREGDVLPDKPERGPRHE